jgi:hypothetical protein
MIADESRSYFSKLDNSTNNNERDRYFTNVKKIMKAKKVSSK